MEKRRTRAPCCSCARASRKLQVRARNTSVAPAHVVNLAVHHYDRHHHHHHEHQHRALGFGGSASTSCMTNPRRKKGSQASKQASGGGGSSRSLVGATRSRRSTPLLRYHNIYCERIARLAAVSLSSSLGLTSQRLSLQLKTRKRRTRARSLKNVRAAECTLLVTHTNTHVHATCKQERVMHKQQQHTNETNKDHN